MQVCSSHTNFVTIVLFFRNLLFLSLSEHKYYKFSYHEQTCWLQFHIPIWYCKYVILVCWCEIQILWCDGEHKSINGIRLSVTITVLSNSYTYNKTNKARFTTYLARQPNNKYSMLHYSIKSPAKHKSHKAAGRKKTLVHAKDLLLWVGVTYSPLVEDERSDDEWNMYARTQTIR